MWLQTTDAGNTHPFSFAGIGTDFNTFLLAQPSNLNILMDTADSPADATGSTGVAVNDGNWHHLAVTWDFQEKQALYLDGELLGENAGISGTRPEFLNPFVGKPRTGYYANGNFSGELAELIVRIPKR